MAGLDPEAFETLRKLGNGDATAGFRQLCAMAFTCPACCQRWDVNGKCACSKGAPPT